MLLNLCEAQMVRAERVKDSLRKEQQGRLKRLTNPASPSLPDRALASFGGLLLSAGKRLQERYAPTNTGLTGSPSTAT